MQKIKNRNSNIELLRIVCILMVIALHYLNGADWLGGLLGHVRNGSLNYFLAHFLKSACIMAVNTFILITGFFACNKTSISIAKPIKLYSLLLLYGIIFSIVFLYIEKPVINIQTLKFVSTTIFYRWFVVIYCVLYILIPFLNKLIHALTCQEFLNLLVINALLFYVINTFSPWTTLNDTGYGIVNFINLYFVGAYLNLYHPRPLPKRITLLIFVTCVLITTAFSLLPHHRAWSYLSIFNLIAAASLFEFFRGYKIKYNSIINYLASYTFAVYIIHGCGIVPLYFYRKLFKSEQYWNSPYMLVDFMICVVGIYSICVAIEFIRRCLLSKICDQQIEKISCKITCE